MDEKDVAVNVESLSKIYRIGIKEQIHDSFATAFTDFLKSPLSNYRKYRSLYKFDDIEKGDNSGGEDILWALKDISFKVPRGESLAVIGHNGAGKSTLLKVLSRVTHPTSGKVELCGRISSLLEVGTGFHPELTGRENVYLNATILGMKKREVDQKFNDIVEFSGVGRFLDTPVKRYSSGMRVRLAFAVAAYLEPDILIIDEVLAVGDAAFQAKCLGKMDDVAKSGRTVLFVSHNMPAVANLCPNALLLREGRIVASGPTDEVINEYLSGISDQPAVRLEDRTDRKGDGEIIVSDIGIVDENGNSLQYPQSGQDIAVRLYYKCQLDTVFPNCRVSVSIFNKEQQYLQLSTELVERRPLELSGNGYIDFILPKLPLTGSNYSLVTFVESNQVIKDWVLGAMTMTVVDGDYYGTGKVYSGQTSGKTVLVPFRWEKHS